MIIFMNRSINLNKTSLYSASNHYFQVGNTKVIENCNSTPLIASQSITSLLKRKKTPNTRSNEDTPCTPRNLPLALYTRRYLYSEFEESRAPGIEKYEFALDSQPSTRRRKILPPLKES